MAASKAELLAKLGAAIIRIERAVIDDPSGKHACPICGHQWLDVTDGSARPLMLWLELLCADCEWKHTINAPLGGPPS